MQAAVRQVDLVERHVDVAQRAFDGVHVASLVVIGTNSDVVFGLYNIKQSTHAGAHKACSALSNVKHAYARSALGPLRTDDRRNVCKRCYNMLATSLRKAFIKIPKSCTRLSSLIIENKAGAPEPFTAN